MGKPENSPNFKRLQRKWYKKLHESGFVDLENEHEQLKQRASNAYRGAGPVVRNAKLDFYTKVSQHTARTRFGNRVERFILECFSSGIKQVNIQKELASIGIRRHRCTIYRIIHKWLRTWQLR